MAKQLIEREGKNPIDLAAAGELIASYEGFVEKPYRDSKGKWTIGFGHLIGDGSDAAYKKSSFYTGKTKMGRSGIAGKADLAGKSISRDAAKRLMMDEVAKKAQKALEDDQIGEKLFDLSPPVRHEILSSYYRGGLSGSPKAKKLIREGKLTEAATEFLDNDEYRAAKKSGSGVATRMESLSKVLNTEAARGATFQKAVEMGLMRKEPLL